MYIPVRRRDGRPVLTSSADAGGEGLVESKDEVYGLLRRSWRDPEQSHLGLPLLDVLVRQHQGGTNENGLGTHARARHVLIC